MYSFTKHLQYVKYRLKHWNKQCFGNVFLERRNSHVQLDSITRQIQDQGLTKDLGRLEAATVKEVEWYLREDIF